MKKLLCLLTLIAGCSVFAQTNSHENTQRKTTFGIKAGLNATDLDYYDTTIYVEGRMKEEIEDGVVYVSLFSETAFNDRWSIGNEITYVHQKEVGFIEIPVLLKYRLLKNFQVFAGPKLDLAVTNSTNKTEWDVKQTLGISAEIGVQYNLGKHWFVECRYGYGFTDMLSRAPENIRLPESNRSTLKLGIGYRF